MRSLIGPSTNFGFFSYQILRTRRATLGRLPFAGCHLPEQYINLRRRAIDRLETEMGACIPGQPMR
jgi:hypothetical protein